MVARLTLDQLVGVRVPVPQFARLKDIYIKGVDFMS
jgi:hypothetical protein